LTTPLIAETSSLLHVSLPSAIELAIGEVPELLETSDFLDSTIARVYLTADPIRRRLAVPDAVLDFPILSELRAEGVTDYLATPLVFTDGIIHVATWTTREPDGFTDAQVAGIEAIVTPLARVAEVRALRRTASTLLDTYVGHDAGERILAGHIRRGDIEEIHAAIWLSRSSKRGAAVKNALGWFRY
jgi:adenylate cyclase